MKKIFHKTTTWQTKCNCGEFIYCYPNSVLTEQELDIDEYVKETHALNLKCECCLKSKVYWHLCAS
jgi:hypothetical protein